MSRDNVRNNIVFIMVDNSMRVAPVKTAKLIIVYDADKKEYVTKIENPLRKNSLWIMEELFEEYDPAVLITSGIDEELRLDIEENGVKVFIVKRDSLESILKKYYLL
jgi:predicted Fe-Mo cluster-binding NifX family protein